MSDYIPPELIPNILARLPVDDVLRCTSVCKAWYSLITSPSFASSHQNLSSSNQEPLLLINYFKNGNSNASYCLHSDDQTFFEIEELDPTFHSRWVIIDSLNGLVCLYNRIVDIIGLWNPSLRKCLILPKPRVSSRSGLLGPKCATGFGFLATTNEYNVVWYQNPPKTGHAAEIYQLSTGSWRDVKVRDDFNFSPRYHSQQAYLKGILHWNESYLERNNPSFSICVYSFDLKNEEFGTMMIPSCLRHTDYLTFELRTLIESLYLIVQTRDKLCDIWMMREYGVTDSWEKLFTINNEQHDMTRFLNFRYNGEILYEKLSETSSHGRGLVSYDCIITKSRILDFEQSVRIFLYILM